MLDFCNYKNTDLPIQGNFRKSFTISRLALKQGNTFSLMFLVTYTKYPAHHIPEAPHIMARYNIRWCIATLADIISHLL